MLFYCQVWDFEMEFQVNSTVVAKSRDAMLNNANSPEDEVLNQFLNIMTFCLFTVSLALPGIINNF